MQNGQPNFNKLPHLHPAFFIKALKETIFYESCPHDSRARLEEADPFTTNQLPWHTGVAENVVDLCRGTEVYSLIP